MFSGSIVGRLGKDPETRATSGGQSVCSFTIATDHGYGERKKTTWTRIVCFGKQAEFAQAKLAKGDRVAVAGQVYMDEWQGREGDKRQTLTMDASFVEKQWERRDGEENPSTSSGRPPAGQRQPTARPPEPPDDGDIPF